MTDNVQTHGFQAEVRELLRLMIHSLYSHREIFLRELISNASDANDKLRFSALAQPELLAGESELKIWVDYDADKKTLTIRDNGIGMTRDEAIAHLGTIAKSGTADFFKKLTGDQQKDSQLIGQFGVGFYSAFIVADEVEVHTGSGEPATRGVRWASKADGEFTVGRSNWLSAHQYRAASERGSQRIRRWLAPSLLSAPLFGSHRLSCADAQRGRGYARLGAGQSGPSVMDTRSK